MLNETVNIVGSRLRQLRKQKAWTMEQLADRLTSVKVKSTIANWEAGIRNPGIDDLQQLSRVLDTSTDYLLGLTDNPYPKDPILNIREQLGRPEAHWDGKALNKDARELIERVLQMAL